MVLETISALPTDKQKTQLDRKGSTTREMSNRSIIGPETVEGMAACPCCNRQRHQGRQTVGDILVPSNHESLFKDDNSDTENSEDWDEEERMMPGVLADGIAYNITKVLVQGWVHKKGTGMDWIGSRAWKPRWAVLALGRVDGHEADVPLLQIYWYSNSPTPSTVIHLDSAVVLPEDGDKSNWNCYKFKIRHVKKSVDESSIQVTRFFSCPREGRDAWLLAINQALLEYEKHKATSRKQSSLSDSPPRQRLTSPLWATADSFPGSITNMTNTAPTLPTSPKSRLVERPVPKPELPLIGEAFLADGW